VSQVGDDPIIVPVHHLAFFVDNVPELGRDDHVLAAACQGPSENALTVAGAVIRRGVEEIYPCRQRGMDRPD
jgi:hypothetical protein